MNLEIFAHDISVSEYDEDFLPELPLFSIQGKDWEGDSFKLVLNLEEAQSLLVQLGFHVYEKS